MRILLLLIFLLLIDLYAFQALRWLTQSWSPSVRWVGALVFWSAPVLVLAMTVAGAFVDLQAWNKPLAAYVRAVLFIVYLAKVLLLIPFIIDDLRRLAAWAFRRMADSAPSAPGRSRFLAQAGALLGGIPLVLLTYGLLGNAYRYRLRREAVRLPELPRSLDGLRIVQISDIHSGSFTFKEPVRSAIDLINQQQADLVFFTGDLVNDLADEMEPFMDVFDKIKARYGVFSVLGNHDYGVYVEWESPEAKQRNVEAVKDVHRRLGWNLLLNENRLVDVNGQKVAVIGVENYSVYDRFPTYGDLEKAHRGAENAPLKLLLSHDPSHWEAQVTKAFRDIALTFSGHTHGFQFGVEIPGWIKWSPAQLMYKQWAGLYQKGRQYLYVNRGLGFIGYPGRVGILPEITVVDIFAG